MNNQRWLVVSFALLATLCASLARASETSNQPVFDAGLLAYGKGDYEIASRAFAQVASTRPSTGALLNLGNAEWRRGRTGHAILAWEQAQWIDPFFRTARENLQFARKAAQIESPYLTWYEAASAWLPPNWWAWLTGLGLWTAVGAALLPGVFRMRRASWQQALSALGLAVFLLSLPAHLGIATRAKFAFILEKDTPLRLTPTRDAQFSLRLGAGEPVRIERTRPGFLLVRTPRAQGWVERGALGAVVPSNAQ